VILLSENELSRKIRDLRALHGLTLEQVAQQVGVGRSTIRKWETGMIENMRRDKIAKLAAALHTTPGYLMGWEDNPAPSLTVKEVASDYSQDELDLIRKYRCLDERGKSAVLNVLNYEYESLPGEKANSVAKNA
jgi:transcriptional regulator with XRE-family HTH domain